MNENKLLLSKDSIELKIICLQNEFKNRKVNLTIEESREVFSNILGFKDWNELNIALNLQEENIQFISMVQSLSENERENLDVKFIQSEDIENLKKLIDYIFKSKPNDFSDYGSSQLIRILGTLQNNSISFQENTLKLVNNYLIIEKDNADDLIGAVCSLDINVELLEQTVKMYSFNQHNLQTGLIVACERNKIEFVKYFLNNHEIDINDVFYVGGIPFNPLLCAIRMNSTETVEYLLTSKELTKKANINILDGEPIIAACAAGNLEMVKYLLYSPNLTENSHIYVQNGMCLVAACNNNDVVNFLLYELNMLVAPDFYKKIENKSRANFFRDENKQKLLTKMIETRDTYFNLNASLEYRHDKQRNKI